VEGHRWQNVREALGVKYAIQAFWTTLLLQAAEATALDPLRVLIKQDNISVVSIRKMGGPKAELSLVVEPILQEGLQHRIRYLSEWIPGTEMPADAWSRELALHDTADWEVSPHTFASFTQKLMFFPTLDTFVSRLNMKCKHFYSFREDPLSAGVDALATYAIVSYGSVCRAPASPDSARASAFGPTRPGFSFFSRSGH
jgi:hypothetical protein